MSEATVVSARELATIDTLYALLPRDALLNVSIGLIVRIITDRSKSEADWRAGMKAFMQSLESSLQATWEYQQATRQ